MFWRTRYLLSYPVTSHQLRTTIFMAMPVRTSHIPACFFEVHFKIILLCTLSGCDSSFGTTIRYRIDGPRIESWWGARYSAPVQTGPRAHPASYTMGTESFPGVERQGRGVDHPPFL